MMYLLISRDSVAAGLSLIILYCIIFLYLIVLSLYVFSTVLVSLKSDQFDSTLYSTPVSLTLSVCDVPIEPALSSVSSLRSLLQLGRLVALRQQVDDF
jgi:hypothetical protein